MPRLGPLAVLAVLAVSCTTDRPLGPPPIRQPLQADVSALSSAPQVGISQVYGGGGNAGAPYKNDFIELFNRSGSTVSLTGWSVQYSSATGTGTFAVNVVAMLSGSIAPGQYVLVQAGPTGTTGNPLPAPDITGGTSPNLSATAGKVILANTTAGIACNGSSAPCSPAQLAQIVDLVGYGGANFFEGTAAAPGLSNTTAAFRKEGGCQDTDDNAADFTVAAPAPRNRASAVHVCPGVLPLGPLDHVTVSGPTTVITGNTIQLTATPQDANNQTVPTATITWASRDDAIATVDATGKVTGVTASVSPVTIVATAEDNGITTADSVHVTVTTPAIGWIDVSSSSTSFPPGFQTQLFATARVAQNGDTVSATFTFEAVDPAIATITTVKNTGIVTGVAAPADGTTRPGFRITATPVGGGTPYSFVSHSIFIEAPVAAPLSIYATNDEFGDPTPATTSDPNDLLIVRPQYTLSYNESRGTPNWVSYELDARQMVTGQDRCNCFTADPLLPADKQVLTSDYTNGGFDRGHMTRSADRTAGNVDNAITFYLTNVVPQIGDLNQGVWARFENKLADSARAGRAVYIITGPLYSRAHGLTFLKNEGKVAIPDSTWKVALIGPRTGGNPFTRAGVQTWDDLSGLTILAVNMPNVAGVRNDSVDKYFTTVDKIEEATGYDFLSLLAAAFQDALEAGDHPPTARFTVSGTSNEGSPLTLDASASTDPDLGRTDLGRTEALAYGWQFSDSTTAAGAIVTKAFAQNGSYTATLTVTDAFGWPRSAAQTLTIANVPPGVAPFTGADLIAGETYATTGSFADPGADQWTATVDYGDGGGSEPLALSEKAFTLTHTYAAAGTFTVTVTVTDEDGGQGFATTTVNVVSPTTAAQAVLGQVRGLAAAGALPSQLVTPLLATLTAAVRQIEHNNSTAAIEQLDAFLNQVDAAVRSGRVTATAASSLGAAVERIEGVLLID